MEVQPPPRLLPETATKRRSLMHSLYRRDNLLMLQALLGLVWSIACAMVAYGGSVKSVIGFGVYSLVASYILICYSKDQLAHIYRIIATALPLEIRLLFHVLRAGGIIGVLILFVKIGNALERDKGLDGVAIASFMLAYLHFCSLSKLLAIEDRLGISDSILAVSVMVSAKLETSPNVSMGLKVVRIVMTYGTMFLMVAFNITKLPFERISAAQNEAQDRRLDRLKVYKQPLACLVISSLRSTLEDQVNRFWSALYEDRDILAADIVQQLEGQFLMHHREFISWLGSKSADGDKALVLLVLLRCFVYKRIRSILVANTSQFMDLFDALYPVLKEEWQQLDVIVEVPYKELSKRSLCSPRILDDRQDSYGRQSKLLICIFWRQIQLLIQHEPTTNDSVFSEWLCVRLEDLFIFFSTTRSEHVFSEHLKYRVREAKVCPVPFLTKLIPQQGIHLQVQTASLTCFSYLCSRPNEWSIQMLSSFPVILVAVSDDNQDLKRAAMNCFKALLNLHSRLGSSKKNGGAAIYSSSFGNLLRAITREEHLVLSDSAYLSSYLTSFLKLNHNDLLVPVDLENSYDESTEESILSFILGHAQKFPAYGKLRVLNLLKDLGILLMHKENVNSLAELLEKHSQYYVKLDRTIPISAIEVDLLCLLLKCSMMRSTMFKGPSLESYILKALMKMDCGGDSAAISPCLTVLNEFSPLYNIEHKIRLFHQLVCVFQNTDYTIHKAAKEAVLRLKFDCSTMVETLHHITQQDEIGRELLRGEKALCFFASLRELLLLWKYLAHRESLVVPLFKLLGRFMPSEWVNIALSAEENSVQPPQDVPEITHASISSIQQTLLSLLEDIFDSSNTNALTADITNEINFKMLVEFAHSSIDGVIGNHIFSLLTSIVKVAPDNVLDDIISSLFTIHFGESTVAQIDSKSKLIFEEFISSVILVFLSKDKSSKQLLEIIVKVLPGIAENRRGSVVAYLLRVIGEKNGLPLLVILFQSIISGKDTAWFSDVQNSENVILVVEREWEYVLAVEISKQFSSSTLISSLVMGLQTISKDSSSKECLCQMLLVVDYIFQILQDPEFAGSLEPRNNVSEGIQQELQELMKGCILVLLSVDSTKEEDVTSAGTKEIRKRIHDDLMTVTGIMDLAIYFRVVTGLLQQQSDHNETRKLLGLISERAKDSSTSKLKHEGLPNQKKKGNPWLSLDEPAADAFGKMCEQIIKLMAETDDDDTGVPGAAISTLEFLATRLRSGHPIFRKCLASVAEGIRSKNLGVSSSCLRTTGALINVLGNKVLAEIPIVMKNLLQQSREVSSASTTRKATDEEQLVMLSVLVTLEAVIDKTEDLMNPHLGDIIGLMVLHPEYVSDFEKSLKSSANAIRTLLTEKISADLALQPLLDIYDKAVTCGDASLVIAFDMLGNLVEKMDRASIVLYHAKIFDQCLVALDIRRQNPATIQNVDEAERSVIKATVTLAKKLDVPEFKELFIRSVEWAESADEDGSGNESKRGGRSISFSGLLYRMWTFAPKIRPTIDSVAETSSFLRGLLKKVDLSIKALAQD